MTGSSFKSMVHQLRRLFSAWSPRQRVPGSLRRRFVVPLVGLFALTLGFLPLSGPVASADPPAPTPNVDFPQCANDAFTGNTGDCNWVNGDLNANNSTYAEGESTVQAVDITNLLPGTTHTLLIDYQTTKNSLHGYDFLTSWNWSELPTNLCDVMSSSCTQTGTSAPSGAVTAAIPSDPNVPSSFQDPVTRPARVFTMVGGTFGTITTPTVVTGSYSGGAYSATSVTQLSVSFTVADDTANTCGSGKKATCEVALWFGAHISSGLDWGSGIGAGGISGSPYHVSLVSLDSSPAGSQDNQLKVDFSSVNGTVVIDKTAVPSSSQLFDFTMTNGSSTVPFQLTGDATASSSQSYSVPPDTWTITEGTNPSGWQLTALVCKDATGADVGTTSVATGVASIDVASGDVITCTYTDSQETRAISLTKAPSPTTYSAAGDVITYTYTITNSGNVALPSTQYSVSDDHINSGTPFTCGSTAALAVGATVTCTKNYTTTQDDVTAQSVVNTAYATGGGLTSNTATATVNMTAQPAIHLAKSASPTIYSAAGDVITYTYTITNSGNVALPSTQYRVIDDHINSGTAFNCGSKVTLAVGATVTCTKNYTITQTDVTATSVTNTAYATGGDLRSNDATALVSTTPQPGIGLAKSASPTSYGTAGDVITYTYTITNTGNVNLDSTQYVVSDDHVNAGTAFACGSPVALNIGSSVSCTATYTITQADMYGLSVTNTATASGGGLTTAPATATVRTTPQPAITVTKLPSTQSVVAGGSASWTITVTNSGNTDLFGVEVTDALAPNCDKTFAGTLAAGTSEPAYTCTLTNVTAGFTNVAVASAYGPSEQQVTDESQAVVTLYTPPVNVRSIGLAKSASPTTYSAAGQTVTYTYVITNTGNVNLASSQYVVSDDHINSGTAFNCGSPVALNVGASVSCTGTYTVTAADVTAGTVTNTATASGGGLTTPPAHATIAKAAASAITLAKSASPTTYTAAGDVITYTYVITNTGNVNLASTQYVVSDDHINSGTAFNCGSSVALAAGATATCTASYTITGTDMAAGSVTNSATASGGGLTSAPVSATVTETGEVTTTQKVSPPTVPTTIPNNGPATGAGGAASSGGAGSVLGISSLVLLAGLALMGVLLRRRRS